MLSGDVLNWLLSRHGKSYGLTPGSTLQRKTEQPPSLDSQTYIVWPRRAYFTPSVIKI